MSAAETKPTAPTAHVTDGIALPVLDEAGRSLLFTGARTANSFSDEPVDDDTLRSIWDLAKWGPTGTNSQPLRVLYVRTDEGRRRLVEHMSEGNKAKTASAPAVAVLATDATFHNRLPELFPRIPQLRDMLEGNAAFRERIAAQNAPLQAGYFLMAVRAHGLAAGPMGGFDAEGINQAFFAESPWSALLVVNIGKPGPGAFFDRMPRLGEEALAWA